MAIEIKKTKRVFEVKQNNKMIQLPDPNPEMKVSEVADFYSGKYPELLNSSFEQKENKGDLIITFKSIAGTKG